MDISNDLTQKFIIFSYLPHNERTCLRMMVKVKQGQSTGVGAQPGGVTCPSYAAPLGVLPSSLPPCTSVARCKGNVGGGVEGV